MTTHILSIALGVLSSLAASVVWLFCFSRLRPRLEVSPFIAVERLSDGKAMYVFKLVNRTRRPVVDVRVRLSVLTPENVVGGVIHTNSVLNLQRDHVFFMERFSETDKDANYAWRFECHEDLEAIWNEATGRQLILRVLATDSLSGLSGYAFHRYYTKRESLVAGSHQFGNALGVK